MLDSLLVSLLLLGGIGSSGDLPFWAQTNTSGVMPEGSGGLVCAQVATGYQPAGPLQWRAGTTLAARAAAGEGASAQVNEAYAGLKWEVLSLDLGMKQLTADFLAPGNLGSLSATGGHMAWSGNARPMPGYTIELQPIPVPFTGKVFWLEGAYGDYRTIDTRYVQNALMHRMQFNFVFKIGTRLTFRLGLDHYAFWGGTSSDPTVGKQPISLADYFRIITGRSATSANPAQDQAYVQGNHLGSELWRWDWKGDGWSIVFQHDIPYEDGSGMGFQNFPDGVNTLWFGWDDKDRWISDILYEYHHTMSQSGPVHDAIVGYDYKIIGGRDNYFNHAVYKSGWTHFGRTIGNPLLYPDSTAPGIRSNRMKAHHFALSGKLFRQAPYKLMLTYSCNYGTYDAPLHEDESGDSQFSGAFQGEIPGLFRLRNLQLTYGLYGDFGAVRPHCVGATVGLRFNFYY